MDKEVIRKNRACLHTIESWIAPEDYRRSRDYYGCPPHVLPLLNLPIDEQPTYTDLLVFAAERLRVELNGWLGQHEHKHTVGVINNIGLSRSSFQ